MVDHIEVASLKDELPYCAYVLRLELHVVSRYLERGSKLAEEVKSTPAAGSSAPTPSPKVNFVHLEASQSSSLQSRKNIDLSHDTHNGERV